MKLTIRLGILSVATIISGFLFQWYAFTQLGPGVETDALFAGMTLPQLVLSVISASLMHVLVPILAGESEDRLRHDAWGLLVLVGALFGGIAIVLYVTATWWIPYTVPGFKAGAQALTVKLTRIQLIGMVFSAINGVQLAAYHARQRFLWAEFTPTIINLLAFPVMFWALPTFGVTAVAWITTLRLGFQTLLLVPGMGRPIRPNLKSIAIQEAWQRIKPLLLGNAYYKTEPMIDRFLLSNASSGSLSLYYLAQQLYGAVGQVINKAIVVPVVPLLSKLNKAGDREGFRRVYYQKLLHMGALSLGGLLFFGILGQAMLVFLVGHGKVSADNVGELWWIMLCLGGMFVCGAMGNISSVSFYALGDTTTPTRIGIYSYSFYIPAKIAVFYCFGVFGLALVTSLFVIVNLFIQIYQMKKKYF